MRYILTSAIALMSAIMMPAFSSSSNDSVPDILKTLTEDGRISIEQPQGLVKRIEHSTEVVHDAPATKPAASRSGYRVEVFSDNNVRTAKAKAASKRTQIISRLPQYKVYVTFEAPFWRVRLGDFTSRGAADAALAEVRQAIPSLGSELRVVRCTINR